MKIYKNKTVKASELTPYENNSRTHSSKQVQQIADSIEQFGFTNPILIDENNGVIAGHGRLEAAEKLGINEVPCIVLSGLTETQKKAYVIADNQLALNAGWDIDLLKEEINELYENDFDVDLLGFDDEFLSEMFGSDDLEEQDENIYTDKIETPIYEPAGESPDVSDLVDSSKSNELIQEIETFDLPSDVREFLIRGAYRHDKFDFRNIAEYYASISDEVIKKLIENSAMVIIDYDKAIELGFVKMTKQLAEMSGES